MDMKALLEKMTQYAGQAVGQKPGDQVRGTEKASKSGKDHPFNGRLVGDSIEPESILKDLSRLAEAKGPEWELAEEYKRFLEAEFKDTADNRPARKGSREELIGKRGHKEQPRYKKIKDESRGHKIIARKLADIERWNKPLAIPTPAERKEQERIAKEKGNQDKKEVKEYSTTTPTTPQTVGTPGAPSAKPGTTPGATTDPNSPEAKIQAQKVAQATSALKSASGAKASGPMMTKAIDAASQGKPVGQQDMKALEPVMDIIGQAAQDPKLANQFRTLAQQAKTSAMQQQQPK